jgi:hypothetical protein
VLLNHDTLSYYDDIALLYHDTLTYYDDIVLLYQDTLTYYDDTVLLNHNTLSYYDKTFIVRINKCIITKCYQKTWQWVHPRFLVWFVLLDLLLYVYDCRSLFVLFLLAIVLSVLLFTDSEYPFGIFKLFLAATAFHTLSMNIIFIMAFYDFVYWSCVVLMAWQVCKQSNGVSKLLCCS